MFFAEPGPAMRGRYLIRSPASAQIISAPDAYLALRSFTRSPPEVPSRPRRILVADWAHLGNVILARPTLRLLRTNFPDAEIGFLTGGWSRHVVKGAKLCDNLHLVGHFILSRAQLGRAGKIRRYFHMRRRALAELHAAGYDVAIDLGCHFPPASPLFYAAGIRVRAGFTSGDFGRLLTHPVPWAHESRPASDYPRDLLRVLWPALKLGADALTPCYPGHPRAAVPVELTKSPYVVLHMGSSAPHREWPEEHWTAIAMAFAADGRRLVFAGSGSREADRVRRVAAHVPEEIATILVDRPWPEYVAVIARAAHVICLESSSAHIAAAFSVPTSAIYPGLNDPVQWRPCNPNAQTLTAPVGCALCYRSIGCEAMACIRGVTPEQVINAVRAALGNANSAQ